MSRRTFMELLTAVTAAHVAAGPAEAEGLPQEGSGRRRAEGRRVVVLGAGLAGLATAYNLMKRGYDVVVLEAQHRPGERVLTVRDGFADNGYAEMGAIRIFDTHQYTPQYVQEFRLALVPLTDVGRRAYYMQGHRFFEPEPGGPWPLDGFNGNEQPDPSAMFPKYVESGSSAWATSSIRPGRRDSRGLAGSTMSRLASTWRRKARPTRGGVGLSREKATSVA